MPLAMDVLIPLWLIIVRNPMQSSSNGKQTINNSNIDFSITMNYIIKHKLIQ